ncbi:nitronate monooxygenase family protein [Roseomonas sp. CECT 9278]|uniref:NAD(P)H-dependent flavin oxidoreductase n=1 Tax=Roseomonas sp. CECT 9278 TaxID=2845823 RepID=UPI001E452FAB|nr:nitronate monooxygenase [Roseomonas sp. CECT 9278]CAH0255289.1 hypothetical protein ROS9278_03253 [Roseomonas sp. CECT 9278]
MAALLDTALTRLLGITHPVLLAPMGSAAGGRLAAAVTRAGGLGLVGSGYADAAAIRRERAEAGNTRVGVGLVTWALPDGPDALDEALAGRPAVVMLSFGDPVPWLPQVKAAGCLAMCQVQSVGQAVAAVQAGADIVIAQGRDAGGHGGTLRGTMSLVPAVVDAVGSVPVVAAGGIADGRGLAAALSLGAAGVLMGTRFAVSAESLWTGAMKQRVVGAGGDETRQTRVFDVVRGLGWPAEFPGRALRNGFADRWHGREAELAAARPQEEPAYMGTQPDDFATRVIWAGEGIDMIADIPTAAEIMDRLVAEAAATLRRGAALLR